MYIHPFSLWVCVYNILYHFSILDCYAAMPYCKGENICIKAPSQENKDFPYVVFFLRPLQCYRIFHFRMDIIQQCAIGVEIKKKA